MFLKVVSSQAVRSDVELFEIDPVESIRYGRLYLYEDPIETQDVWLPKIGGYEYLYFRITEEEAQIPAGRLPDRPGEPWWQVTWAAWTEKDQMRAVVTLGDIYLLNGDGRTIDRVR